VLILPKPRWGRLGLGMYDHNKLCCDITPHLPNLRIRLAPPSFNSFPFPAISTAPLSQQSRWEEGIMAMAEKFPRNLARAW
jgi:hypothetical protein